MNWEEEKIMEKKYVSVSELVLAGYGSRATILSQIHTGEFIAKNPGGGKWLVDRKSYETWLQMRTNKPKRKWRYRKNDTKPKNLITS